MTDTSPIELVDEKTHLIYRINGTFDAAAVKAARNVIEEQVNATQDLHIIDMSDTVYVDSSGIGAIVFLYKRLAAKNKNLVMLGLSGQPADLMKMLRIDKVIKIYASLEDVPK